MNEIYNEELAELILGLPEDSDPCAIEDALHEKYGISMENFGSLISDLIPYIDKAPGGVTGILYKGFAKDIGGGTKCWVVKVAAN